VTHPESDASAQWREHENFNLIYTPPHHPLFGSGFWHEDTQYLPLQGISVRYSPYKYNPPKTLLALLNSPRLLGFAGFWTLLVTGILFAVRSYHRARRADDRSAALSVLAIVLVYLIQGYGDVGLASWNGVFILSPVLAIVGKLAVLTGAWPRRRLAPLG